MYMQKGFKINVVTVHKGEILKKCDVGKPWR